MKLRRLVFCVIFGAIPMSCAAKSDPAVQRGVSVEIEPPVLKGSLFHWKIKNSLDTAVYVYDFYLWGPAFQIETPDDRLVIDTAPVSEVRSCPPNRFPPVLLLVIAPGRTIEGDFADSEIKNAERKPVLIRIAVGSDPYSVVAEAKRFYYDGHCRHNPYDAIVRWGTILESNILELPEGR